MDLVNFIHEVGTLKLIPRSGWLKVGVKNPESVAEHSFRAAIIAFLLAKESGIEKALKSAFCALVHDLHESRTMDLHGLAKKYVKVDEEKVKNEQVSFGIDFKDISDVEKFVKDADKLELAFQAVEYSNITKFAIEFAEELEFETDIARKIYEELMKRKDPRWWR
ncbi:MAG: HD family hydrolase [Archaeoglobaceae archaeon]|nr:HD family hydrolase [Archaeoglobaceae archaeon]MDW7990133.1 HD family hydrolase [Archaeoglobaceae archaeon]